VLISIPFVLFALFHHLSKHHEPTKMATEAKKDTLPPILLSIDLQQGMVEGPEDWGSRSTPNLVENVKYLLSTWRSKSWPIIHVQHDDIYDSTNIISAAYPKTYAIHPSAAPSGSEPVVVKNTGSAFLSPDLPALLATHEKDDKKTKIVVIGMDGTQCIASSVRHGDDLGYDIVVVGDACASYPTRDWKTGKELGAEETHDQAMNNLTGITRITTTKEVLGVLGLE
jgi:nicotinamidase-related amidase